MTAGDRAKRRAERKELEVGFSGTAMDSLGHGTGWTRGSDAAIAAGHGNEHD
jgi:hypothetical protein